jgi:hypothetical protein
MYFDNCFISITSILLLCELVVSKQYIQCIVTCSSAVLKVNHKLIFLTVLK